MQVVVREDSAIKTPKDLKGKTITAMSYSDANFYALLGVLASAGLTKNDVNAQAVGPAGVWQLFAAGKSDAMTGVPEWIAEARATGIKLRIMPAYDYFGSMAQAILASDETIQKRPDLVRKVVKATLHGLRDVMTDPKSAARDYVAAMPLYAGREAFVEEVFALYNQYVYPDQKVMGMMDPARLTALQNFYVKEGKNGLCHAAEIIIGGHYAQLDSGCFCFGDPLGDAGHGIGLAGGKQLPDAGRANCLRVDVIFG